MIPLLDTKADKDEIEKLSNFPKPDYSPHFITPIVIPLVSKLNPDSVMRDANVLFDLGEGPRLYSSCPSKSAGWLVYDKGNSGSIKTGYQMFGNYTFFLFWKNGYEALSSLDNNQDGKLEGGELKDLAVWSDKNCDGKRTKDEIQTLTQLGVVSISCAGTLDRQNMLSCEKGIYFATGESRKTFDFILQETSEKSLVQSRPENKL
ncbi:MAG: hypothetical protein P4L53_17640 [Candidatus Obscuribacterales bacterium]|nr:hypothetical protein [Candidatus Obscuribacterales bacterium]